MGGRRFAARERGHRPRCGSSRPRSARPVTAGGIASPAGRTAEARRLFARLDGWPAATVGRAQVALDSGRYEEAADLAQRYLRHYPHVGRLERCAGLEVLVRAEVAAGRLESARTALAELRETAGLAGTRPLRAATLAAAGVLAAADGDDESAKHHLEDAVDLFSAAGAPYEAAMLRFDLARSLTRLGRTEDAQREMLAARRTLRDLGLTSGADDVPDTLSVLSQREQQVLGLVAAGLTNADIARRLVLSQHTVHRHVTSILRKLGVPNRAAAASLAARHGLG